MAQPTPYTRQYNFTTWSTGNPTVPVSGVYTDAELNAVKTTLDQVLTNLALIQRDDGGVANLTIGTEQLKASVLTGINSPAAWVGPSHSYSLKDSVTISNKWYVCIVAHVSTGVFATDLAAGKWLLLVDLSGLVGPQGPAGAAGANGSNGSNGADGIGLWGIRAPIMVERAIRLTRCARQSFLT